MRRSERHVPGIEVGPRGWPGSGFIVRVCVRGGFSVKDLQETLDEWGLQDGVGDWGTRGLACATSVGWDTFSIFWPTGLGWVADTGRALRFLSGRYTVGINGLIGGTLG